MINSIDKINRTLLICFPISLALGPFISNLLISIISVLEIILLSKKKHDLKFINKKWIILLLFIFYIFLNSIFNSVNFEKSIITSVSFLRYFFVLVAIKIYFEDNHSKKLFFQVLKISTLIICFDAIFQYFVGINFLGFHEFIYASARLSGIFGDEKVLGGYLVRFLPLFLISIIYYEKNLLLKLFGALIYIYTIIISGERTAFFFVIMILTIFAFLSKKKVTFNNFKIISSFIVFFVIINIFFTSSYTFQRHTEIKNLIFKGNNLFSKVHDQHYYTAYKIFLDNKAFGSGPKTFRYLCNNSKYNSGSLSCSTHPHNILLQILSEIGILGLIFYLILLFYLFFLFMNYLFLKYIKSKKFSETFNYELLILINILVCFWPFSPSGNFFGSWLSSTNFFVLGFLFLINGQKSK